MKTFADMLVTAARLKMLQLLRQANGYSLNNHVLQTALDATGIRLSGDQVRAELAWLEQMRTIRIVAMGSGIDVAELLERGHDVAKGVSELPGIDRPVPGSGL